jgi:hypothetical protein
VRGIDLHLSFQRGCDIIEAFTRTAVAISTAGYCYEDLKNVCRRIRTVHFCGISVKSVLCRKFSFMKLLLAVSLEDSLGSPLSTDTAHDSHRRDVG